METSTIAIIILIATLILYAIPKMPLSVTTILAILAMVLFGVVDFASATSGFANNVVFLNAGMMIIGQAMVTTGLAQRVGNLVPESTSARTSGFASCSSWSYPRCSLFS